jgi:phenylacetate-CoA ligase
VLTNLGRMGSPVVRYRTGDRVRLTEAPCACGRTFRRLDGGILGRLDDMLIIRGVNLFPSNIETLLLDVEDVGPHYRLIVERPGEMDEVSVECEPAGPAVDRVALRERLESLLRDHTGIRIPVSVVEPGGVPRSEGKAVRVIDRR